jgi:Mor family transcriptional regulator
VLTNMDFETRNKEIVCLYIEKGRSLRSLAKQFQLSTERIRIILERRGVALRPAGRPKSKLPG